MRSSLLILMMALHVSAATYYVNPSTGSDSNDGLSAPGWQTVSKINGFSFSSGDTLVIDTSAAMLDMSATNLTLSTSGLTVKATNGQYWACKLWQTLTNAHFSASGLPANCYSIGIYNPTGFGQSNIVVWESEKWMYHPTGITWASVSNYVSTNAGSFWTDGGTIYLHPFGDSSPLTDGKVYTRSVSRNTSGGASAINLNGSNMSFRDCYAGKTCMASSLDNDDFGAYVIGTGGNFGGTSMISNCVAYYGSKHCIGLVQGANNSDVLIVDCIAEQATPYASQSCWVSFMGTSSTNNVHHYLRCVTVNNTGLIGSTNGYPARNQPTWLSHTSGGAIKPFRALIFNDCYFPAGQITPDVATNVLMTNCTIGGISSYLSDNLTIERCLFDRRMIAIYNTDNPVISSRNCIFKPYWNASESGNWVDSETQGAVSYINCTFDISGATNFFYPDTSLRLGLLNRTGPLTLTFSNNAYIVPQSPLAWNYSMFENMTNTDTLHIGKNVYGLGPSNIVAYQFCGTNVTFSQWQTIGFDGGSLKTSPLLNATYYAPMRGSPVIGAGINVGPATDFTGQLFSVRDDVGAMEFHGSTLESFGSSTATGKAHLQ